MDESFYVGTWLIEPRLNRISADERSTRVEPKVMGVLVELSRNPGQVVSRERLFEVVWSGTVVTDDVLTRSVSELRKVFGDDSKNPSYIETIPKTGYRLVAPVSASNQGRNASEIDWWRLHTPASTSGEGRAPRARIGLVAILLIVVLAAIWSIGYDGSTVIAPRYPIPVTTYPGRESPPKLSPDGRQVAFAWRGETGGNLDLYVKYVDAVPVLRLTNDSTPNSSPAWSPDGTEIAFINRDDGCNIRIISAIGGSSRAIGSCGESIYGDLAWSPDGAWLAFNDRSDVSESFAIHLMSPSTGERHRLTDPPGGIWGDHDPVFSPDGERIAFVRSVSEGMQDVYVSDDLGLEEERVTFENRNIWGSDWMPDGTNLVVASNRTGRPGLWMVDIARKSIQWLGVQSPAAGFPSIAGGNLAFLQIETDVNLWHVPLDGGGEPRQFAPSTYWDLHPAISPDGTQVAFASNRSGSYEIWVADSLGGSLRQLTRFGGPFTSSPRWSPEGSRLTFAGRPDGNADVFVMSLNSAEPQRITDSPGDDLAPDWLPDGGSLVFTSNRSGTWEAWQVDLTTEGYERLTYSGTFGARPLPSDDGLLFSRPSEPGLWRVNPPSGPESEILEGTDPRDWGSWDIANNRLYYVQRGAKNVVVRLDLNSGRRDTVFEASGRIPAMDPALAVSPDGRWLLIGQVDREETDIMVVELIEN